MQFASKNVIKGHLCICIFLRKIEEIKKLNKFLINLFLMIFECFFFSILGIYTEKQII